MSRRVEVAVPNLWSGVSQQPDVSRETSRLESCINFYPSIVAGLGKRPPTEHKRVLLDRTTADSEVHGNDLWHLVNRSSSERYVIQVGHEVVRVWDLDGTEYGVYNAAGTLLTQGHSSFSYLDRTAVNSIPSGYHDLEQDGGTAWNTRNSGAWAACTEPPPFTAGICATLRNPAGAGTVGGKWIPSSALGSWGSGRVGFGIFVKEPDANPTTNFSLRVYDTAGAVFYSGRFSFVSGKPTYFGEVESATLKNAESFTVTPAGSGWYWVSIAQPTASGPTASLEAELRIHDDDGTNPRDLWVCGPRGTKSSQVNDGYLTPTSWLRATTTADYTLVSSRGIQVSKDTPTSDAESADKFVFVKEGAYESEYRVDISHATEGTATSVFETWDGQDTTAQKNAWHYDVTSAVAATYELTVMGVTYSHTPGTIPPDSIATIAQALAAAIDAGAGVDAYVYGTSRVIIKGAQRGYPLNITANAVALANGLLVEDQEEDADMLESLQTTDIADKIKDQLTTAVSSWAAGNRPTITRAGSVVRIVPASGQPLSAFEVTDSSAGTLLTGFGTTIEVVEKLPTFCADDHKVKIVGNSEVGDTTDDYYVQFEAEETGAFGEGRWVEAVGFSVETDWDADTMPHQLVSKQDDGSGTVTGSANSIYFEWGPVSWDSRIAGDDDSNPFPGIVDRYITEVFFHKGRFGILADQSVVLSESSEFWNLFRTTAVDLIDSDPIDIVANSTRVSILRSAAPVGKDLLLVSEEEQFLLEGQPLLTPQSAAVRSVTRHEAVDGVRAVGHKNSAFVPFIRNGFTGVIEIAPEQNTDTYGIMEITMGVPQYIAGNIHQMDRVGPENCFLFLSQDEPESLWGLRLVRMGNEEVQAAFFKWTFGTAPDTHVVGAMPVESMIVLVVLRDDEMCLETVDIAENRADPNTTFLTLMDRRVTDEQCEIDFNGSYPGQTAIKPTFTPDADTVVCTRYTASVDGGAVVEVEDVDGDYVVLDGDYSNTPLWIGKPYTATAELTRPYPRIEKRGGTVVLQGSRLVALDLRLNVKESGYFTAQVAEENFPSILQTFDKTGTEIDLTTEEYFISVNADVETLRVTLENDSPWPSTFLGGAWMVSIPRLKQQM